MKGLTGKASGKPNLPTQGLKASEKVFGKTDRKAQENQQLNSEIEKIEQESKTIQKKLEAANNRVENLDKELKGSKLGDVSKTKILLDKSANADKLIGALKQELNRLKKIKSEVQVTEKVPQKENPYVNY